VLQRLTLARAFLGTQDPLDFFRGWNTPEERHTSLYASDEHSPQKRPEKTVSSPPLMNLRAAS